MIRRDISFVKGDSHKIKLRIKLASGEYFIPKAGDRLYFTAKLVSEGEAVIKKYYPSEDFAFSTEDNFFRISFNPEDTENLKAHCDYLYDIELSVPSFDKVKTVVKGTLLLCEDITKRTDYV